MTDQIISALAQVAYKPSLLIPAVDLALGPGLRNVSILASALAPATVAATQPQTNYLGRLLVSAIDPSLPVGSQGVLIPASQLQPASLSAVLPQSIYKSTLLLSAVDPSLPAGSQAVNIMASVLAAGIVNQRTRLTQNFFLYVATNGDDAANTGRSAASPFQTISHAWNVLLLEIDLNGFTATINVAAGTYTAAATLNSMPIGFVGGNPIQINGAPGATSIVLASALQCILAQRGAYVVVQNISLSAPTGTGLYVGDSANLGVGVGVVFGACANHMIVDNRGRINITGQAYSISGSAQNHALAIDGGYIAMTNNVVTFIGAPLISSAVTGANDGGIIDIHGTIFTGSPATGTCKFRVATGGIVETNGAGINALPGSVAGVIAPGGIYG